MRAWTSQYGPLPVLKYGRAFCGLLLRRCGSAGSRIPCKAVQQQSGTLKGRSTSAVVVQQDAVGEYHYMQKTAYAPFMIGDRRNPPCSKAPTVHLLLV